MQSSSSITGDTAANALTSGNVAVAQLAGQLHGDVAAERVAGHGEARQPVAIAQLGQHAQRIGGQPRVIEPARQVLGAAAIALVEPDDVESGGEGLLGQAAHVMRFARALETVQRQQRRRRLTVRLPVAVRQHPRVGGDVEKPGFGGGKRGERRGVWPTRRASSCARRPSGEGECRSEYLNIIRRMKKVTSGLGARWRCRATLGGPGLQYPTTKTVDHVDTYHGTSVADPVSLARRRHLGRDGGVGRGAEQGHVRVSRQDSVSRAADQAAQRALQLRQVLVAVAQGRALLLLEERRPAEPERALHPEGPERHAGGADRSEHVVGGRHRSA